MDFTDLLLPGSSLMSGFASIYGANKAAKTAEKSAKAAAAEDRRQYDTIRNDSAPYRAIGSQAINTLGSIYGYQPAGGSGTDNRELGSGVFKPSELVNMKQRGLNVDQILQLGVLGPGQGSKELRYLGEQGFTPEEISRLENGKFSPFQPPTAQSGGTGNALAGPDYSSFYKSPDYTFRQQEGMNNIQNSFAARGGAASGNALRALTEFNSNLAAGEFGNYFNRQAALAGIGQTATNQTAQAGLQTAGNVGNALMNAGNARASGIVNQTNAITGTLGDLAGQYGYWQAGRKQARTTPSYAGNYDSPGVRYG